MRPHIDLDAAGWFVMAFIASAFGILPLLALPMLLGIGRISSEGFLVAQGLLALVVYGVAGALLVRARPWRRLIDLVWTLFLLTLAAALLMAVVRFVAAPGAVLLVAKEVIPAATFGLVQVQSFAPLKLGSPDPAQYVGLAIGLGVERWLLRRAGKPVGAEARPLIEPWPLKESASSETSATP
jgi:hypothetical protein